MFDNVKSTLSKAIKSRILILILVLIVLAFILVQRLFQLQIINGESYQTDFTMQIKRTRELKSTRGNILDSDGNPLAYNRLSYSVTFADSGSYNSTKEQNLTLNSSMYGILKILEDNGDEVSTSSFAIGLDDNGSYYFTKSSFNLQRFKADIYGRLTIDDMSDEEKNATAEKMIEEMCAAKKFGLDLSSYDKADLEAYGLPDSFTKEEILKLAAMRSAVASNSYQKYVTSTLATDVSEKTMSLIMENKDLYPGVDIEEDSIRVYEDSKYFAPLIGYTGQISAEEMESLNADGGNYKNGDIVGKSGLEQHFEKELQGEKGSQTVYVDNMGKVVDEEAEVNPEAGSNIQLTINRDLQKTAYDILESYIAAIVYQNMVDAKEVDNESGGSDEIRIPVYEVYYALFENQILDVEHLSSDDASDLEKQVYQAFLSKEENVFSEIRSELTSDTPTAYQDLTNEMKAYSSYIVNDMLAEGTGILDTDAIDKNDETYKAWREDETISLKEFLTYAISKDWIDIGKLQLDSEYLASEEIYNALAEYIFDYLKTDDAFTRQVYKYMIEEEQLSGRDICLLLFDQGILEKNDDDYTALASGTMGAYDFIRSKIYKLELTPAQLALEPCSGSVVITDPDNGNVLACVTYPSYDNNLLANTMDSKYYEKLRTDKSSPFYNRATQEVTAPGSTFKLVTATAGVMENKISIYDTITCTGKFDLVEKDNPINCWIYSAADGWGSHGPETLETAIRDSCNFYFNTVGYYLGQNENGEYVGDMTLLNKYAEMYGFDSTSGIEISEMDPQIATADPTRAAMGQSNNAFTTSQLARYVTTLANSGTCYDLTLLDKITDASGNTQEEPDPVVHNRLELPQDLWTTIHAGMHDVTINNGNGIFANLQTQYNFNAAGKTGTAQQRTDKANHALFIGYAPYENPEISMAVRITNGYSSRNAALVAKDIMCYYFNLKDKDTIIDGTAGNAIQNVTKGSSQD